MVKVTWASCRLAALYVSIRNVRCLQEELEGYLFEEHDLLLMELCFVDVVVLMIHNFIYDTTPYVLKRSFTTTLTKHSYHHSKNESQKTAPAGSPPLALQENSISTTPPGVNLLTVS